MLQTRINLLRGNENNFKRKKFARNVHCTSPRSHSTNCREVAKLFLRSGDETSSPLKTTQRDRTSSSLIIIIIFLQKLLKRVLGSLITKVQCHGIEQEKVLKISLMFCRGFALGRNLAENEFRLNVANYESDLLARMLRGINMSSFLGNSDWLIKPVGM